MRIEEGKFYRTVEGHKAGPVEKRWDDNEWFYYWTRIGHYTPEGLYAYLGKLPRDENDAQLGESRFDFVAEWADADPVALVAAEHGVG
jgi:hypothetical protein